MRLPRVVTIAAAVAAFAATSLAATAVASREVVVHLSELGFSPAATTIAVGDRVRFTVRDRKPHQLAKTSGSESGDVAPNVLENKGSSVTLMPNMPGTYTYIDRLNPSRPQYRLTVRP